MPMETLKEKDPFQKLNEFIQRLEAEIERIIAERKGASQPETPSQGQGESRTKGK